MQKCPELMIFIAHLSEWAHIAQWPQRILVDATDKYWQMIVKTNHAVEEVLDHNCLTGVYFGNEFCEKLMPSVTDILECYYRCNDLQLSFTLVTPLVSDLGLQQLEDIFQVLAQHQLSLDIVFNDWGVCKLLDERYPQWQKRVGRTLDKMIREPRLNDADYQGMRASVRAFMQEPPCFADSYRQVLQQFHVHGVELDCVPQGYDVASEQWNLPNLQTSLYFPFYCITSGRLCMMKALGQPPEMKWNLESPCACLCQQYNQVMQKFMLRNGKKAKLRLLRKGNAVFGCNPDNDSLLLPIWDRLIWQPQPPL